MISGTRWNKFLTYVFCKASFPFDSIRFYFFVYCTVLSNSVVSNFHMDAIISACRAWDVGYYCQVIWEDFVLFLRKHYHRSLPQVLRTEKINLWNFSGKFCQWLSLANRIESFMNVRKGRTKFKFTQPALSYLLEYAFRFRWKQI